MNKTPFRAALAGLLLLPLAALGGTHSSEHHDYRVETLVEGLDFPWALAFLPNGDWLITERDGRLRWVRDGELQPGSVSGVPDVHAERQGGLLDVVLHPDFENNRWVYLSYAIRRADGKLSTAMGRGEWHDGRLENYEELFVADAWAEGGRHHGSRILFDDDGFLFLTVGDRGERHRAQDPHDHAGTTLRLHDDGSIPADNPFVGRNDGDEAVWTWGNRNAQGMALHPERREVWQHEHGPRGGDEINRIQPGVNYGWPVITHGREYHGPRIGPAEKDGLEQPLMHWTPSIAPSGMAFYTGDAFPKWRGDVLVGALAGRHLARVSFDGEMKVGQEQLLQGKARIRDVRVGPDGLIYVLTDDSDGQLLRLSPAE